MVFDSCAPLVQRWNGYVPSSKSNADGDDGDDIFDAMMMMVVVVVMLMLMMMVMVMLGLHEDNSNWLAATNN